MATATELRQTKGKEISMMQDGVTRYSDMEYYVKSQSNETKHYNVARNRNGWSCSCPDFSFRGWTCKHIYAVQFSYNLRQVVKREIVLQPIASLSQCQFCGSSKLVKFGVRKNKCGEIQRFLCEFCKRTFSLNVGFAHMRHNPQAITMAMDSYFRGMSLRNTQKALRNIGVKVSYVTVYNWINKYVSLMEKYASKIQPNVSDVWRADEIYVKVRGNMKYLFALMDDETRFWIAQEVADTKEKHNPRGLFANGKEIAGKRPVRLITDGLESYHNAWKKEFRTIASPQGEHIKEISLKGRIHNNKMERMNGEFRDREKVTRGLKTEDSPMFRGYQIFHNFIREHEALNGKTPSESCGIKIEGDNKWKTLIENASVANNQPKVNTGKLEEFGN